MPAYIGSHACMFFLMYIVASFLELGPILLAEKGVQFFLTERLSQDPLESYFGEQRSRGHRNTNPNVQQFSINANILRVSSGLSRKVRGNVRGWERELATSRSSSSLNPDPLRKRRTRARSL